MTWEPGPVVTRRRLGGELKRLRVGAGMLLEEVALKLECSSSKISRLENGKGIPRYRDVRDMLDAYGVRDGDLRERLLEWSRTGQQSMWWSEYAAVLPPGMSTYIELEWDASRVQAYEAHIPHGLLQTRDYAHAVLETAWGPTHTAAEIERLVDVRVRRKEALAAGHGLTFLCVLDESALYRVVGSTDVLRGQLRHLMSVAETPNVELRILPFAAGLVVGASQGSFAELEFNGAIDQGLVYVERPNSLSEFLSDRADVTAYRDRYSALLAASLPQDESMPLLARAHRRSA